MKKTTEIEYVVCAEETSITHPELFHYTKRGGFIGILESKTFRASHFEDMEDKREVWLLQERIVEALAPCFDALADRLTRHRRRVFDSQGRGAGGARRMIDSLYGATFASTTGYTKLEAFMASFSSHAADSAFERENGLWSQWENYAGFDGFCIVLDTAEMGKLLQKDPRYWVRLTLEPARYASEGTPVNDLLPEFINAGADVFLQYMKGFDIQEMAVAEFLMGSTLLKRAKYREEREVRIVAIPGTEKLDARGRHDYPDRWKLLPLPAIMSPNGGKRFVTVFENQDVKLPIKRIIVGPAAGQAEVDLARSLVGNVPVTVSRSAQPPA